MELTVIITCYNNEKNIEQCIRSVLTQTFMPREIIVVDDCSWDGTLDIVERLKEEAGIIRLLQNDRNRGPSAGRNRGITEATTEYVTTLDGDDYYHDKDKLRAEMSLIEEYRIQGEDIIAYSYIDTVDADGNKFYRKFMEPKDYAEGKLTSRLLAGYRPATFPRDYCVKRDILIDIGLYREDMRLYEDLELLIRMSYKYRFFCTGQYGTCYRISDKGLSSAKVSTHKKVLKTIWKEHIHELHGNEKMKTILLHAYTSVRENIRGVLRWVYRGIVK